MSRLNALDTYPGRPTQTAGPSAWPRPVAPLSSASAGRASAIRLFLALVVALLVVGAAGHELISHELNQHQIDAYAGIQRADAQALEATGERATSAGRSREIGQLINAIGERPGADEVVLIGPDNIIRASTDPALIGHRDSGPRIDAALVSGASYAGREADPDCGRPRLRVPPPRCYLRRRAATRSRPPSITPSFDAQLAGVRQILILVCARSALLLGVRRDLLSARRALPACAAHRLRPPSAPRATGSPTSPTSAPSHDELRSQSVALGRPPSGPARAGRCSTSIDFKLINDRHGHPQGDAVLKRVAAVLRDGRSADRAFRLGGDEFAPDARSTPTPPERALRVERD